MSEVNTSLNNMDIRNESMEDILAISKNDIEKYSHNKNLFLSHNVINNPIVNQLILFGYNNIYSKRIVQYFHPQNIEEALDYLSFDNKIIQHHFIENRDRNNMKCYVCGEKKKFIWAIFRKKMPIVIIKIY